MSPRKPLLGGLVTAIVLASIEGGARLVVGDPPQTPNLARLGRCTIQIDRLSCVDSAEQERPIPPKSDRLHPAGTALTVTRWMPAIEVVMRRPRGHRPRTQHVRIEPRGPPGAEAHRDRHEAQQ